MSVFGTPAWLSSQQKVIYSLDLKEATYNIPHSIMQENCEFIGEIFADNPVWEVYGDLFRITTRSMDMSTIIEQGYDVPPNIVVKQGSFMGDALSFMHLTLMLSAFTSLASASDEKVLHKQLVERPMGQSVGDDLILFNAKPKIAKKFDKEIENFGQEASKIKSTYFSGVFTEQYFIQVTDRRIMQSGKIHKDSLFGDLWFVDGIKPMVLTGKPKVSAEKRNSFIGQATALNKMLKYLLPSQDWKRLKCRVYLWVNNYDDALRIGRAKPHMPPELGGISVPIGACDPPGSALMKEKYIPYLATIADMPHDKFLAYYMLLKGIFRSTPKGVPWSNDPERLLALVGVAALIPRAEIDQALDGLDFYVRMGQMEKIRYLSRAHNWVPAVDIDDELSRRETYLDFWYEPGKKRDFRTLRTSDVVKRHNEAWSFIRATVAPKPFLASWENDNTFDVIAERFRRSLWGFFVRRDDPAISWVFQNVNTFWLDVLPT